jgi:hypothetical protein
MLEMLRKKLIDAGIDTAVGSMDYWGTELEGVLLDMYDSGAAAEREACAKYFDLNDTSLFWGSRAAKAIRARENNEDAPLP